MASKINSVGDNGSDLGKGDSNMDPDCVVEKLSVSMQSCEPFCTPQVDSFQSLVVGPDTLRTDLITGALDDVSIAESSGQKKDEIDTVGKDDVASDSKSKGPDIICSSLWTTNEGSIGSQLKTDAGRPFRKCKKLSNKKISPDIKFVELSRKRRSFSNKARISNWGSLESIGDVFNQTAVTDADLDQNEHRKSRKAKGREGDVKRKINQSLTSLLRSKKKIHASTNRIRLKVTFGGSCPLDVTSGVVDDHKSSSSMQIKSTIYNEETERKLEQGIPSAPDGHDGIAAQKEVGLFEEAVVSRCLDPGTSPDSEVINLIPENHTEEKIAEYVILNKQTCIASEEVLSTSLPMKCSRKGKKKNKYCQIVNCNTNNKPPPDTIDHTGVTDQHRHFARSTNDVLLNEASRSTTSRNISVKISSGGVLSLQTPLQSSVVTDCGGVSETFKAEDGAGGGSCSPTGFQHKTLEKSGPLPKLRDGANTISSRSPRSRLEISKAQSPDKNSCLKEGGQIELKPPKKSNCAQAVNKNENYLETGSHTLTDHGEPITGCSITPEVTYVNMNGVKDEHVMPRNAWVSCDNCYKWRRIPAVLADSIEDTKSRWICKDNVDKDFADCSIPQEKSNAEINAELDISDASCEEDAGAALHEPSKFEKKNSTVSKQSSWKLIKLNHFLHRTRKTQTIDEIMVCHCKAPSGGRMGCGNGCLNRMLNIECVKGTCPCGEHCSNNQFQKRKYAKLKCFRSGKKGCGLQLLEDIREGQFLIEYVGEVLDMNAYEDRQKEYALKGHKHFYFMTLNGSEVIDACAKGNLGRYINHSCEPNCRTEKWMVNGEVCVGLFAIRDIKKGEEVTFDYNYVRVFGAAAKKCVCGSSLCQGYIGGDPSSDAIIVQDDSDEEDPESVMVCEDSDDNLDSMVSASNSADVIDTCYAKKNVGSDERVIRNLEVTEEMHNSYGLLKQRNETNMFKSSGNEGYVQKTSIADHKSLSTVNLDGNVSSSASMQPIDFMPPQDGKGKFIHVAPPESCSEEHLNKLSTTQSSEISATKSNRSSMDNSDIRRKFKHDVKDGRNVVPASHHKTKVSYSVSSVKNGKPRKSDVLVKNPAEIGSRLHHLPFKTKRPVNCSPSDPFEAVQVKLNELLDAEGGISKKKDASRGYLKLLFLTAASENSANGEAIQSNRDLSMILDALLKTKSRTVLADVINKNGLQMLHNIMKRCRKEFHKIPILRKLLKVLEYLAVKEILTLEHITSGPRFAGVESFRESILSLTVHDDKQVHKIARTFRNKWIRRPTRNKNYTDIDTGKVDFHRRASNCNRSALQSPCDMGVGLPGSKEHIKKPMGVNRVNCENLACCSVSCSSECVTNKTSVRKRKSRWDQPADSNFGIDASSHKKPRINSGSVQVSISSPHHGSSGVLSNQAAIMYEENRTNRSINYFPHQINVKDEDDNGQNIDEDIPPGFSAREGFFVSSSASSATVDFHQEKCSWPEHPYEVVRGHPQKMFISRLPVSFGIPLLVVEQFGRPLVETSENWVVAAGIPFHPYPPLPTYPHDRRGSMPASSSIVTKSAPVFGEDSRNCGTYQLDQSTCSTPDAAKANLELDPTVNQHNSQRTNGASNCLERRYFRQQKWSNAKSGHPWVQGRAGRVVSWNSKRNGMNSIGIGTGPRDLKGPTSSERIQMEVGHCGNTFLQHPQQNN